MTTLKLQKERKQINDKLIKQDVMILFSKFKDNYLDIFPMSFRKILFTDLKKSLDMMKSSEEFIIRINSKEWSATNFIGDKIVNIIPSEIKIGSSPVLKASDFHDEEKLSVCYNDYVRSCDNGMFKYDLFYYHSSPKCLIVRWLRKYFGSLGFLMYYSLEDMFDLKIDMRNKPSPKDCLEDFKKNTRRAVGGMGAYYFVVCFMMLKSTSGIGQFKELCGDVICKCY